MKRLALAIAVLIALATGASAWSSKVAYISYRYDLDSTDAIYPRLKGQSGDSYGGTLPGLKPITTSGSSTTVVAVTADDLPFGPLAVGDVIFVSRPDGTTDIRFLTAKASGDSVTVNAAINLDQTGGFAFRWLDFSAGTAATDGWIDFSGCDGGLITFGIAQMNATAVLVKFEAKTRTLEPTFTTIYPGESSDCGANATLSSGFCRFTAASEPLVLAIDQDQRYTAVRVGIKIDTDDGGDTGANAEQITAAVECNQRN